MGNLIRVGISIIVLIQCSLITSAQEVGIVIGKTEIPVNLFFTITIKIENDRLKSYDNFPDIPSFTKRGTSSSSSTNIINGKVTSSQSVIQNYLPDKQGRFVLKPFTMTVNGKKVSSPGATIIVGPPRERSRRDPFREPLENFFPRKDRTTEFIDIKDEAFLALTTDNNEVFVGEGFNASLSFYVAESNRAPLQFYELGKQLSEILKKIKPSTCWEENFNIENISGDPITINNKRYTQYRIYQATYFPLNLETINFPSVSLEMIKYKVAKNPSFFGRNRQENFKTFYSKPKSVTVKSLPPHPLMDKVPVGEFELEEKISQREVITGQSFNYQFNVYGKGNIASVPKPEIVEDDNFDFYDPNIVQNINRRNNRVTGTKSFRYYGLPNEPGEYGLGNYFSWIFFNPEEESYDTLTSNITIRAIGESKKNQTIMANDLGEFYNKIEFEDNSLRDLNVLADMKIYANIIVLLMLFSAVVIIFKK